MDRVDVGIAGKMEYRLCWGGLSMHGYGPPGWPCVRTHPKSGRYGDGSALFLVEWYQ